jgi:hypothetical protein
MKSLTYCIFITTLCFWGCSENKLTETDQSKTDTSITLKSAELSDTKNPNTDKIEIRTLVRKVLNWSETKNNGDLLPLITDDKDSLFIGFDLDQLKNNLIKLKSTGFFSTEFINNYNSIILKLDEKMRKKEIDTWSTGEIPPFAFASNSNPWCNCQDTPGSWDIVEVYPIRLNADEGELYWNWGNLGKDFSPDWNEFKYKFKVKKEDGKWKISYLEGFDFKESTQ